MKIYYEKQNYTDKNTGEVKQAINYYVLHPELNIRLRMNPNDFTTREILIQLVESGNIESIE